MHTLFGKSLMQVDCNEMDVVTKQVLKLSSVDAERFCCFVRFMHREKCNQIGLLNDLCVWLTQCYRFFSNVSACITILVSIRNSRSVLRIR